MHYFKDNCHTFEKQLLVQSDGSLPCLELGDFLQFCFMCNCRVF